MMTEREIIKKVLSFSSPPRFGLRLAESFQNDFSWVGMYPHPDARPLGKDNERDEWGTLWGNIGISKLGEAKEYPLADWSAWDNYMVPDVTEPKRWKHLHADAPEIKNDKFRIGAGLSIYERIHFLRGLENTWEDIYLEPERLQELIDTLTEMNLRNIELLHSVGVDGYFLCDDWGLQNKLMISPEKWREFWFPAYRKIFAAAHQAGMHTFMHSCGYILEILNGLIEAGLDCIMMEQQCNMTLEKLSAFRGRITFCCPVDIQQIMGHGDLAQIRAYCHELAEKLGTRKGGFIADFYADPVGAGHSPESVKAMCEEFEAIANFRE